MQKIEIPTPEEILTLRTSASLTQEEAGEIVHVARRTFQDWERGVASMPLGLWELFRLKIQLSRK